MGVGERSGEQAGAVGVRRLNWGCGKDARPGWINSDRANRPGVDVSCDIREGLPIEDGSIDYAVSVHALQELGYDELVPALSELRRVLRPGGTLRLVVPDLEAGIRAYLDHDHDHFLVAPEEARSHGGRFIAHMLWHGHSRTLFTFDFIEELLIKAGFVDVTACQCGDTASGIGAIVELDGRERESIFVEATRPPGRQCYVELLALTAAEPDERIAGCHLDTPSLGAAPSYGELEIGGWVVGRGSLVTVVEVTCGDDVVGHAPVEIARAGVAQRLEGLPGAAHAGFKVDLESEGEGRSELGIVALLEDGERVPLWTLDLATSRLPLEVTGAGSQRPPALDAARDSGRQAR